MSESLHDVKSEKEMEKVEASGSDGNVNCRIY